MLFEKRIINIYERRLLRRRDPDGRVHYFSKEDFPGLGSYEYTFTGDKGQTLTAFLYYKGEPRYDRLIILDHGMGCGHYAYLSEIDEITRRGYTVFTYNHTGTRGSGGENIGGFSQSLSDLDRAITFVRTLDGYKDAEIAVIGHSWGGFAAMNIAAIHPEVTHIVAISGFISPKTIQNQALKGLMRLCRPTLARLEREALPDYCGFDGRESMKRAVNTKALFIHSRDDKTCSYNEQFFELEKALGGKEGIEFLTVDKKNHHPQYTEEAVVYKAKFNKELSKRVKNGTLSTVEEKAEFVKSYDWRKMNAQDTELWDKICEFLKKR